MAHTTLLFRARNRRGFALIVALSVLVLLSMLAFGAASIVHVNQVFLTAKLDDRRLGSVLNEAAQQFMASPISFPDSSEKEVLKTKIGVHEIQILASVMNDQQGFPLLGTALKPRSGDRVVIFSVAAGPQSRPRRSAIYLINGEGHRKRPILLLEKRT